MEVQTTAPALRLWHCEDPVPPRSAAELAVPLGPLAMLAAQRTRGNRPGLGAPPILTSIWRRLVKTNGTLLGRCTILVGMGMFTGGTIWILTHGHVAAVVKTVVVDPILVGR